MSRVEGVAKVTGKAKYAAEFKVPNLAYGFIVLGDVAKGTIKSMDTKEAEGAPGDGEAPPGGGVGTGDARLGTGALDGPSPGHLPRTG